jgi:hypothetical protein
VCTATTGFFVLGKCERLAHTSCSHCTRSICDRHMLNLADGTGWVCPECYASARGFVSDPLDPAWASGYRRNFYWTAAEATGDNDYWSDFDTYDQTAFDADLFGGDQFVDTGDDGSLLDS